MLFRNNIKFPQMPFSLIPKVLDIINMILFIRKKLQVINAKMSDSLSVHGVVPCPTICVHNAIRHNFLPHNEH